jgi:hypothetical protein
MLDPKAPSMTQAILDIAEPIQDLVEGVAERALCGPTELTTGEVEMLLPTLAEQERLVGVRWAELFEIPSEVLRPTGPNPF